MSRNLNKRITELENKTSHFSKSWLKGIVRCQDFNGKRYIKILGKWLLKKQAMELINEEYEKSEASGMLLFYPTEDTASKQELKQQLNYAKT